MGAFSPSAPITNKTLFAGRNEQMNTLVDITLQDGRHGVIYGERGVGKTSLALVMKEVLGAAYWPAYYTCSSDDTFGSIWRQVLESMALR
jgi:MoxR-like ATPase